MQWVWTGRIPRNNIKIKICTIVVWPHLDDMLHIDKDLFSFCVFKLYEFCHNVFCIVLYVNLDVDLNLFLTIATLSALYLNAIPTLSESAIVFWLSLPTSILPITPQKTPQIEGCRLLVQYGTTVDHRFCRP